MKSWEITFEDKPGFESDYGFFTNPPYIFYGSYTDLLIHLKEQTEKPKIKILKIVETPNKIPLNKPNIDQVAFHQMIRELEGIIVQFLRGDTSKQQFNQKYLDYCAGRNM